MAWKITTRRGHQSGTFRRDGHAFTDQPTYLETLTPGLETEYLLFADGKGSLIFDEVPAIEAAPAQAEALLQGTGAQTQADLVEDLGVKSIGELRALAKKIGLPMKFGSSKEDLVAALREKLGKVAA